MTSCGSRACPVCFATGMDVNGSRCPACLGTAPWFPFPWTGSEDGHASGYSLWTAEESAIVTAAPSVKLAVIGHTAIYGPVRSYISIRNHRNLVAADPGRRPVVTEAALEAIAEAPTAGSAASIMAADFPSLAEQLPPARISIYWRQLHRGDAMR